MKVTIWVQTGDVDFLHKFIHGKDIGEHKIKWLKFPDSVGTRERQYLFVQVELLYGAFKKLSEIHPYIDLD